MVQITEIEDDQGFHIPRTTPVVVGVPGGQRVNQSRPNTESGATKRRNYPTSERILELADGEESEDDYLDSGRRGDLTEEEMRRIASGTGIMKRKSNSAEEDVPALFQAILISIPMAMCFAGLRYAVRTQYQVWEDYSLGSSIWEAVLVYVCSVVFVALTTMYKDSRVMDLLLGAAATGFGCWMVQATEIDKSYGSVMRTPGLAILWIYTIARGNLLMDTVSLGLTYLYYVTKGGKSLPTWLQPGNKMREL